MITVFRALFERVLVSFLTTFETERIINMIRGGEPSEYANKNMEVTT